MQISQTTQPNSAQLALFVRISLTHYGFISRMTWSGICHTVTLKGTLVPLCLKPLAWGAIWFGTWLQAWNEVWSKCSPWLFSSASLTLYTVHIYTYTHIHIYSIKACWAEIENGLLAIKHDLFCFNLNWKLPWSFVFGVRAPVSGGDSAFRNDFEKENPIPSSFPCCDDLCSICIFCFLRGLLIPFPSLPHFHTSTAHDVPVRCLCRLH